MRAVGNVGDLVQKQASFTVQRLGETRGQVLVRWRTVPDPRSMLLDPGGGGGLDASSSGLSASANFQNFSLLPAEDLSLVTGVLPALRVVGRVDAQSPRDFQPVDNATVIFESGVSCPLSQPHAARCFP